MQRNQHRSGPDADFSAVALTVKTDRQLIRIAEAEGE
jgi:hypothetical protein